MGGLSRRDRATIIGLLDALDRDDIWNYTCTKWTAQGRASAAENLLDRLAERGLVRWVGDIEDATLTDAGRAKLADLKRRYPRALPVSEHAARADRRDDSTARAAGGE